MCFSGECNMRQTLRPLNRQLCSVSIKALYICIYLAERYWFRCLSPVLWRTHIRYINHTIIYKCSVCSECSSRAHLGRNTPNSTGCCHFSAAVLRFAAPIPCEPCNFPANSPNIIHIISPSPFGCEQTFLLAP